MVTPQYVWVPTAPRPALNCVKQLGVEDLPPAGPLEYIEIDILGELPRSWGGHRYLLFMTPRYSKLTGTVLLRKTTAATVSQAFISHCVFVYRASVKRLYDNGSQFTSRFFLAVCKFLSIESVFTTAYNPQTNDQVRIFNLTLSQLYGTSCPTINVTRTSTQMPSPTDTTARSTE